ncbi:hypothetical protein RQP46_005765 [Phenoliferia psychrophenolica]
MLASFASPFIVLALSTFAFATHGKPRVISIRNLAPVHAGKEAYTRVNLVAGILSADNCPSNSVIGLRGTMSVTGFLDVCACLTIIGTPFKYDSACPTCPVNSQPVCVTGTNATCSCACNDGFYAIASGMCIPDSQCPTPNTITPKDDGTSVCTCAAGYVATASGGCSLGASGGSRRRSKAPLRSA